MKLPLTFLVLAVCLLNCKQNASLETVSTYTKINKDTVAVFKNRNDNITKAFVLGKFNYKLDSCFVVADNKYTAKPIYLKRDVYKAFLKMHDAAMSDGVELKIISGTRNFEEQKIIWERKWRKYKQIQPYERALKILEYSSMPSTSRHHWGTDLDLNSLNNSYFNSGKGLTEYNWLKANANQYGFYQVYTNKNNGRTGYNLEKWHWSYLPLAQNYLEFYNKNISIEDINGFMGYNMAKELNVIKTYVNGISQKVKDYN